MKTTNFIKNSMKASTLFLFAVAIATSFSACDNDMLEESNDNQQEEAPVEIPRSMASTNFDDLQVMINTLAETDDNGQVTNRFYGEALDAEDPSHLYIGVDGLQEAKEMFELWMAPDVTLTEHGDGSVSAALRDEQGRLQGTVHFTPSTEENHIAEVITDIPQECFSRITFLKNEAWPCGKLRANQNHYYKFDIVERVTLKDITQYLQPQDRMRLNFVCIQGSGNGVKPIFCAITWDEYTNPFGSTASTMICRSKYCPSLSTASNIQKILLKEWNIFTEVFKEAGGGKLIPGTEYWIDDWHSGIFWKYNEVMDYHSGNHYGEDKSYWYRFILKMDGLDDSQIHDGMSF